MLSPSSYHPGGVVGLLVDGSVRFIAETVNSGNPAAAFVNAVMDAIKGSGVRNIDMPVLPDRVYKALQTGQDVSGAPPVKMA